MDSGRISGVQSVRGATLLPIRVVPKLDPVRQDCHVDRLPIRAPAQHKLITRLPANNLYAYLRSVSALNAAFSGLT